MATFHFYFMHSVWFELFILSRHYLYDQKKETKRHANFSKQNKTLRYIGFVFIFAFPELASMDKESS